MISIIKQNGVVQQNINEFIIDEEIELKKLPKISHGSTCLVTNNGDVYILNGNKEWKKINVSNENFNDIKNYIDSSIANAAIGQINLPTATQEKLGLVKGSSDILVQSDGSLILNDINIEKIIVPKDTKIILNSGNSLEE